MNGAPDTFDHKLNCQFDKFGGMDADVRPYMLKPEQWRMLTNIRTFNGMPQVTPFRVAFQGVPANIRLLANVPVGDNEYGFWLGVSETSVYHLSTTPAFLGSINQTTQRFGSCVYNDRLVFVNPDNPVTYTDGSSIHNVFDLRRCQVRENGFDFIGDGPFTKRNASNNNYVIGDLGNLFTWTSGSYYRVYHKAAEWFFVNGATVEYFLRLKNGDTVILTGTVVDWGRHYIVLLATNTVSNVPNSTKTVDGAAMRGRLRVTAMDIPRARYVAVFYDHVVVGNTAYKGINEPNKVMWSNLRDWADWVPRVGNEADSYLCSDYQYGDDVIRGVTGIQPFKMESAEMLVIFTPSCIYGMTYTGLPRVMRVFPLMTGFGNGLAYATVSLDDRVVWCDVNNADFFVYRGQGPESIGQGIRSYFFSNLSLDSDARQKTWAYVDRLNFEVVWNFVSQASLDGKIDKAVAFNYRSKTWHVRDVPNVLGFSRFERRAQAVSELIGTTAQQTGTCGQLARTNEKQLLLFTNHSTYALTPAQNGDTRYNNTNPVLETGDFLYGSAQKVKEVYSFTINASGSALTGIDVYVSARQSVDDAVSFDLVGTWTPTLATKMLTFAPRAGKVLRYKFIPQGTLIDFVWSGFEEAVRLSDASR